MGMDRQTFEAELKRDGYEILTNTTPGAKVNPEHSHPFDVRAMVLKGAITITSAGEAKTYKPGEIFDHGARLPAFGELRAGRRGGAARPQDLNQRRSMKAPALGWQTCAGVRSVAAGPGCGLIGWLQNVHIITANGMYKSIQAEPWIADPAHARLDPSNYLYFPLYGALARAARRARHPARRAVEAVRLSQRLLGEPRRSSSSMPSSIA